MPWVYLRGPHDRHIMSPIFTNRSTSVSTFTFLLRLPSNGQAQILKYLYLNVMFAYDIKPLNFL